MTDLDKARGARSHGRKASRTNRQALSAEEAKARMDERNRLHLARLRRERAAQAIKDGAVSTWAWRKAGCCWRTGYESEETAIEGAREGVADEYWAERTQEVEVAQLYPVGARKFRVIPPVGVQLEGTEDE